MIMIETLNHKSVPHPRKIHSFVRRLGRMTDSQEQAIEQWLALYGFKYQNNTPLPNLDDLFPQKQDLHLEIGFGMGKTLLEMAITHPHKNYLGIEVHRPGIATVLKSIHQHNISNLRIIEGDAVEILKQLIPDESLRAIYLFFPDPWPKKRHHKRRIVQPAFIDLITQKLKDDGFFHTATDWQDYAKHMLEVLAHQTQLINQAGQNNYATKPNYRSETKFEARGKSLGHQIYELIFVKKA